jgi:hypothetical protein
MPDASAEASEDGVEFGWVWKPGEKVKLHCGNCHHHMGWGSTDAHAEVTINCKTRECKYLNIYRLTNTGDGVMIETRLELKPQIFGRIS